MIFQESGITFNNVKKIGTKISAFPVGNPDNYEYGENSLSRKDTEHIEDKGGFVNAIDIDWNGVQVNTIQYDCGIQILNTTSDLLNWIKCLEHRISVLEGGGGSGPINPDIDYYRINWNDNGATTAHQGGSTLVYIGQAVVLPTTNPQRVYSIEWNDNGGTIPHSDGSKSFTYEFNNWWDNAVTENNQITSITVPTGDDTYYAHWIPGDLMLPVYNPARSYRIYWNANGGIGPISGGSDEVNYTFNGWYTTPSGGTQVTSNTKPTATATYYANWISPSGIILPTTNPTRSGYNFMGWATTSGATVANVTANTIPTGPTTYYAVWQRQGVVLSSIEWTEKTASSFEGESIDLPTITLIYSDNHTNTISASLVTLNENLTTDTSAGTYHITATYNGKITEVPLTYTIKTRPVTQYTVTFNGNGGTISGNATRTVNAGNSIGTFPSVTYSGHELTKWTYSNGNTANPTDIVNDNITIYAQWQNIYTVKFVDRGNVLGKTTGPTGTQVTKPSDPSRSGYKFEGWNENESAGIGGTVITSIGTSDITYYAQWKEVTPIVTTYTVTYHSNGGNSTPLPQTVNAGETVTLAGAINRNADSSYTYSFKEWNENSGGTAQGHEANETIPVNDNIDLYAQWISTPIPVEQYTVTFDANGGNSTPSPIKVDKNTTITLPAAITRDADESYTYSFKKWNTHRDGNGSGYYAEQDYTVTTNVTLYATWNRKAITPVTNYKWYVGTTQPTAVDNPSTWRTSTSDAGFISTPNISTLDKIWVAYPSNWTLEITDVDGYGVGNDYLSSSIKNSINGYIINRFTADSNTAAWVFKFIK